MTTEELVRRLTRLDASQAFAVLETRGLVHEQAMDELLDEVGRQNWSDPREAVEAAEVIGAVAARAGLDRLVPRGLYLEAQMRASLGQADRARALVDRARQLFVAGGDHVAAARTTLGLANLEVSSGRLDEAEVLLKDLIAAAQDLSVDDSSLGARAAQNLASIAILRGHYQLALDHLDRAGGEFQQADDRRSLLEVRNNEAMAMLGLGRVASARSAIVAALDEIDADKYPSAAAELCDTRGRVETLGGDLAAAIGSFRQAIDGFESVGASVRADGAKLALADVWLTLNLHEEAAAEYRRVVDSAHATAANRAWAMLGLAQTLAAVGDRLGARRLLADAFAAFADLQAPVGQALTLLAQGSVTDPAETEARLATLHRMADLAKAHGLRIEAALAELALADAGDGPQHVSTAVELLADHPVPSLEAELQLRLGLAALAENRRSEAKTHLRAGVEVVEHTRGRLASERHRRAFLSSRLRAHETLIGLLVAEQSEAALSEAFEMAERSRARALIDAMANLVTVELERASDPDASGALGRVTAELQGLHNQLLGDDEVRGIPAHPTADPRRGTIQHREVVLAGRSAVTRRRDLQPDLIRSGATFVGYHLVDDGLVAFVVTGTDLRTVTLPCRLPELRRELQKLDAQIVRLRSGEQFRQRWANELERATAGSLRRLSAWLTEPLELAARPQARPGRLVVSPADPLHGVPFAALVSGGTPLVDSHEVVLAPSASAWRRCVRRSPATGMSKVYALPDPKVPNIRLEGVAIAQLVGSSVDLVMNERASRAHVLGVRSPRILHIATHGVYRHNQPMFSTLRVADGDIAAHELAALDLDGSFVALSACESGRGAVVVGEELLGFPRALLTAGAKDVLVSSWLAHDHSTKLLMEAFYGQLCSGAPPAAALRRAQLEVRETHSHPFHWAAFADIGAGFDSYWDPVSDLPPHSPGELTKGKP